MNRPPFAALIAIYCTTALLGGCHADQAPSPAAAAISAQDQPVQNLSSNGHVATDDKADLHILRDDLDILLQLDIYELTVPLGAISGSDRFWKHIDEDHVDLTTHALLLSNGLRFGIGPNDEWAYYKSLIDHYGATAQKGSTSPVKRGTLELPMRSNIDSQDIFFLTDHWKGRTYEKCDNLLALTFEPTPRRPGDATIQVCALVRGLRKQFEVTVLNDTREIELRHPEYLYDLRLRQNVPMDHFLVLAPSPLSTLPDNLGHTFFVKETGPQPTETVLILVPRPYRITGDAPRIPMARTAPAPH
ncbi:MAG TPA: hypothetical protein VG326_21675 [Tepidisphaeraceae bacterium]|jgi:hypothetical protein|nr:hypothetical protein [Tepidisphaeraceae bacterium]